MTVSDQEERTHPAVFVEIGPWREKIDVDLAPLICEIWKAGIETLMSCQETEPGIAWIEFVSVAELLRFLNLIAVYEQGVDTMYNRINNQLVGPTSAPVWEYQLNLLDIFEGQEEQVVNRWACFDATAGVYFPRSDIPLLVERLESYNRRGSKQRESGVNSSKIN